MPATSSDHADWIRRVSRELGFDRCGIAPAGPIDREAFLDQWLARGYGGTMGYLDRHRASRRDVRAWLPWARSVIVVALSYAQPPPDSPDDRPRGRVAMYAWGADYHAILREKLEALTQKLSEHVDHPVRTRVCVDTAAIIERALAARAGIGWIGKNTMVLHRSLGSFFFLGEIITDLPLAADPPALDHCGTCTRCLEACPTDAFPEPYVMDASRCISYLTIEHRADDIAPALANRMGDWVFGCDLCQTVCPYNRRAPEMTEPGFRAAPDDALPVLDEIIAWDEAAYRRHVHGKATRRAKLQMWKRNASIARRNRSRA